MKLRKITSFLKISLLLINIVSCTVKDNNKQDLLIDSLNKVIETKDIYINYLEKRNSLVGITNSEAGLCKIILYQPFGLTLKLMHQRPQFNNENLLCVPAAYTTKKTKIDGLFIENGNIINHLTNDLLTGICIINKSKILIYEKDSLSLNLINKTKSDSSSLFQQTLLVKNKKIVPCNLFGDTKNIRRALIQFDNSYSIGESNRTLTIHEFQESLINIGSVNAVNLDMGSWSEGWYKNQLLEKVIIGESFLSTSEQTNWIVFKK